MLDITKDTAMITRATQKIDFHPNASIISPAIVGAITGAAVVASP